MDGSNSPMPSPARGESDPGEAAPDGSSPTTGEPSLLSRFLRRASGFATGAEEVEGDSDEDGLGPAFAKSTPAELAMVANILRLRSLRVQDVMTPRADIVAVPAEAALPDVLDAFDRGSFSRVPVYRETLDDPIGFVHLKDLAMTYGVGCQKAQGDFTLSDHTHRALFVPPSMRIAALLQQMQGARVHMALVIDEFGGVDGLVTIEDLVEQIVGDIEDEHDGEDAAQWREESPGVYLVDARTDIREFEAAESVTLTPPDWDEVVDTLGGLVFMFCGRVPTRGEVISHPLGHEFQIVDADPRRIKRLRLTLSNAAAVMLGARKAAE